MDSHGILYQLDHRDINALIDINKRGGSADGLPDDISLDKEAHPLCRAGPDSYPHLTLPTTPYV